METNFGSSTLPCPALPGPTPAEAPAQSPSLLATVHSSLGTLPSPISGGIADHTPLGLKAASV